MKGLTKPQGFSWKSWSSHGLAYLILLAIVIFLWRGSTTMSYNWQWFRIPRLLMPRMEDGTFMPGPILEGLKMTFVLALVSVPIASAIGLIMALISKSKLITLRWFSIVYVETVRNTPMLVQLYLIYFLFASIFSIDRVIAGVMALAIFEGAFAAEIFRAGLTATPKGQLDAARSLGLGRWQSFRLIAIPQSLPLILPPLANLFVSLLKHSSLVSVIAIPDLTNMARNVIADTYLTFEIWLVVAGIYITVCFFLSKGIGLWEKRLLRRLSAETVANQ